MGHHQHGQNSAHVRYGPRVQRGEHGGRRGVEDDRGGERLRRRLFDSESARLYDTSYRDPDVDVVYVATPHPMHFDDAMLAIEHGKPVLVEKAFTINAVEARRWSRSLVSEASS